MTKDSIVQVLTNTRDLIRALESVVVDLIAAASPWLAPVIPAFLVYRALIYRLQFPWQIALISAVVVEFLGLSTVHTAFSLWDYNETRRKSDQRAPVAIALVMAVVYISAVMVVNVLLDDGATIERIALSLLSLLTVVASVTLAIRANHARRLEEIREQKAEARASRPHARKHDAPMHEDAPSIHEHRAFICKQCSQKFENAGQLASHVRWEHKLEKVASGNGHSKEKL